MALFKGEKEAIKQVLDAGAKYGYGNMIAWLRRGWSDLLMKNSGFTQEQADMATIVSPYPKGAIENMDNPCRDIKVSETVDGRDKITEKCYVKECQNEGSEYFKLSGKFVGLNLKNDSTFQVIITKAYLCKNHAKDLTGPIGISISSISKQVKE